MEEEEEPTEEEEPVEETEDTDVPEEVVEDPPPADDYCRTYRPENERAFYNAELASI